MQLNAATILLSFMHRIYLLLVNQRKWQTVCPFVFEKFWQLTQGGNISLQIP